MVLVEGVWGKQSYCFGHSLMVSRRVAFAGESEGDPLVLIRRYKLVPISEFRGMAL